METPKQESPKQSSIDDINEKLKDVRLKRLELSQATKASSKKSQQQSKAVAPLNNEKIAKKKPPSGKGKEGKLYHPNIEYAVEKIVHSPYLTKPSEKYPGIWHPEFINYGIISAYYCPSLSFLVLLHNTYHSSQLFLYNINL